uniref:Putative secreted protein n=1 Tax=Anopheles darlingi TaxID=43151 RepID=A0A2M4D8M9_ANODA
MLLSFLLLLLLLLLICRILIVPWKSNKRVQERVSNLGPVQQIKICEERLHGIWPTGYGFARGAAGGCPWW